jgi:hypothetical protein
MLLLSLVKNNSIRLLRGTSLLPLKTIINGVVEARNQFIILRFAPNLLLYVVPVPTTRLCVRYETGGSTFQPHTPEFVFLLCF